MTSCEPLFVDVEGVGTEQIGGDSGFGEPSVDRTQAVGSFRMARTGVVCLVVGMAYEGDGFQGDVRVQRSEFRNGEKTVYKIRRMCEANIGWSEPLERIFSGLGAQAS